MDILFRRASLEDKDILFTWRNNEETRAMSVNTAPVHYETHIKWLEKSLSNEDRMIFIAEIEAVPVGTVRFDRKSDGWEMSWTVAPEKRRQGIGKAMVKAAVEIGKKTPGKLYASMKHMNIASRVVAKYAGFVYQSHKDELSFWLIE